MQSVMPSINVIEVSSLSKVYNVGEKFIKAIDDVSFSVKEGMVFGLLGPNGAGKTTTIKVLTTLTRPDKGRCIIGGFDLQKEPMEVKRLIAVVPQENNLDRELTAYENLLIYGKLHGVKDLKEKIEDKLRMVALMDRKDTMVSQFSGGMQRRLLLARALLSEPAILFLDEPTIGLDPQIRRQLWDVIRKTRIDGRTVVLTTHYIEEAEALCDQVAILSQGSIVANDTPENLKKLAGEYVVDVIDDTGKLSQSFFSSRDDALRELNKVGIGAKMRTTNLEDAFVRLTGMRIE
jgi:ABC-2 type transport system ATP-binding protein